MVDFILGGLMVAGIWLLTNYAKSKELEITWWGWLLTIAGMVYTVFVLEVIVGFVAEGFPQAAVVMGGLMALLSIIWGVLMVRFVYRKPAQE